MGGGGGAKELFSKFVFSFPGWTESSVRSWLHKLFKLLNPTQWLPQKCSYTNCNCNSNCQELSLVRSQNSCIAYWRKSGPRSAPASSSPASAARSPPSSSSLSILVTCRSSDWGGVYVISSSTAVDFSLVLIEAKLCYLQHNRIRDLSSCEL